MKRLYENIEEINIKGSPTQLYEAVTAMDVTLQGIADGTEQLFGIVAKYSAVNHGAQYSRMMETVYQLRDTLIRSSTELNVMQNEVVAYMNKVFRYEEMSEVAAKPNAYMVQKATVNVDNTGTGFVLSDMLDVESALSEYSEAIYSQAVKLNQEKDQLASIWCDSQYDDFATFVESVCRDIIDALKIFDDYRINLDERIKELN